ncbi:unnamed protein product [Calicophoron daubneyi]|uniref:Nuclear cap-binding protein subunit 3 n=1 Tax=Calicophoron daubneyi TaxID=300641 RepID=A0AAV2T8R5_CALDB
MSVSVPGLKVTVDLNERMDVCTPEPEPESERIYCSCQSEYCDCGSKLGVTEAAARNIYGHLGFQSGRDEVVAEGYRPCALHIWGTHNLSTEDVLSWLSDYHPANLEWINDASCNAVFESENTILRIIVDCAEPFDRRVALAAAAAVASLMEKEEEAELQSHRLSLPDDNMLNDLDEPSETMSKNTLHLSTETLNSIEEFSQYLPPTGRWYKALSAPPKAISLFLRFAHKTDVKLPGAERRSLYYRRYGNPNYGGMTGILSRSYRRRLRLSRYRAGADADGSLRHVRLLPTEFTEAIVNAYENPPARNLSRSKSGSGQFRFGLYPTESPAEPAPERKLVVYDNLYDGDEQISVSRPQIRRHSSSTSVKLRLGTRREAVDFPVPKSPRQPRKWPRKDRGPAPNRWLTDDYSFSPPSLENINVVDLREPWATESSASQQPFFFSGKKSHRRVDHFDGATTTITLMPDSEPPLSPSLPDEDENAQRTRRLLASMTMVADMEEKTPKNRSLADRLGFRKGQSHSNPTPTKNHSRHRTGRDVWHRLG